jgi:hypothetical protein
MQQSTINLGYYLSCWILFMRFNTGYIIQLDTYIMLDIRQGQIPDIH